MKEKYVKAVVFDKTGTLTKGEFVITKIAVISYNLSPFGYSL